MRADGRTAARGQPRAEKTSQLNGSCTHEARTVIITKSQLAQELRVTRSAVSRYCERGMPTRSDGRLDREVALRWIEANVMPAYHHGKGAQVAGRRLERPMPECLRVLGVPLTEGGNVVNEAMAATLIAMVQNVPC
jgi:hypothetical protein